MKTNQIIVAVAALATLLAGCSLVGSNPKAPSKAEQLVFNTVTNYLPVTNVVTQVVTVYKTNDQTQAVSSAQVTNQVATVALEPHYTETVKPSVTQGLQGVGTAVNTFFPGFGGMVSTGLAALLGLWAYLRSSKQGTDTSGALAQEIQTILTFVAQLPNGQQYVSVLTDFLRQHQQDEDVLEQVAKVLATEVSNTDAKVAANQVIATINGLKTVTDPVAPIAPV